MEFGYNTDVAYGDDDYHVQTEGKFGANPRIDTLVYKSGSVLHKLSRKQPGLSSAAVLREATQKLIKKQHLRVVSLIRKGDLDRLAYEVAHPEEIPLAAAPVASRVGVPAPAEEFGGDATIVMRRPAVPPRHPAPPPPPVLESASTDAFLGDGEIPAPPAAPEPPAPGIEEAPGPSLAADEPEEEAQPSLWEGVESEPVYEEEIPEDEEAEPSAADAFALQDDDAPASQTYESATDSYFEDDSSEPEPEAPREAETEGVGSAEPPPMPTAESMFEELSVEATARAEEPFEEQTVRAPEQSLAPIEESDEERTLLGPTAETAEAAAPALEEAPADDISDVEETIISLPSEAPPFVPPAPPVMAPPPPRPPVVSAPEPEARLKPPPVPSPRPMAREAKAPVAAPRQAGGGQRKLLLALGLGAATVGLLTIVVVTFVVIAKLGVPESEQTETAAPTATESTVSAPEVSEPGSKASASPTPAAPSGASIIKEAERAAAAGEAERALAALEKGLSAHRGDSDLAMARAQLLRRMGRDEEALLAARRLAKLGSEDPRALYLLGDLALSLHKDSDASAATEALGRLAGKPGAEPLRLILQGRASFEQGKVEDAAALIRQAIAREPGGYRGYLAMGEILFHHGIRNGLAAFLVNARDYFEKAALHAPEDLEVRLATARLQLASKDLLGAQRTLQGARAAYKSSYHVSLLLGEAALRLSDPQSALASLKDAMRLSPSRPEAQLLAGTASNRLGQDAEAVDYFLMALVAMPQPDYRPYPEVHPSREALRAMMADSIKKTLQADPGSGNALKLLDITVNL